MYALGQGRIEKNCSLVTRMSRRKLKHASCFIFKIVLAAPMLLVYRKFDNVHTTATYYIISNVPLKKKSKGLFFAHRNRLHMFLSFIGRQHVHYFRAFCKCL